jgi:hypothetical protein
VGSCRQLIEGADEEDRALGSAGMVVQLADPAAFAQAVLALLADDARWLAAQQAGLARVRRYYTKTQMIDSYRTLYDRLAAMPDRERNGQGTGAARCPIDHGTQPGGAEPQARAAQPVQQQETR